MKVRQPIHISWHIAWACAGVVAGCALAPLYAVLGGAPLVLAGGLFCLAAAKRTAWLVLAACGAGLLLGLWRGSLLQQRYTSYRPLIGVQARLQGAVTEDATVGAKGDQRFTLGSITYKDQALPGKVWVSASKPQDIKRGDTITVTGKISEGFGSTAASMHRAMVSDIIRPYPGDIARRVRDWFSDQVRSVIREPEASLGLGFLTGQHSTLPEELDGQLRALGLTHIVVASGYNLTVLVQLARNMFSRLSKYLAALASSLMIICFMAVTGLSPSMSRAGLVAGLSLVTWYYGRVMHPMVLLLFAAALTLLINPAYILGDIGWYLSFGSFVGVIILAPLLQHYFWGTDKPGVVRQILVDTFSAQLVTLPVIAFTFGQYSLLALPANLLVLPFVPLAMLLTCIGGVVQIMVPGTFALAGLPAEIILRYMTTIINWLGDIPWAYGETTLGFIWLIASYAALLLVMAVLWRATGHDFRQSD